MKREDIVYMNASDGSEYTFAGRHIAGLKYEPHGAGASALDIKVSRVTIHLLHVTEVFQFDKETEQTGKDFHAAAHRAMMAVK